jgi:hypothetical protein
MARNRPEAYAMAMTVDVLTDEYMIYTDSVASLATVE